MTDLLISEEKDVLIEEGVVKTVYDQTMGTSQMFLPKISNPSLLNFVDRIGFKMIPVEKYRKLQTEEKGIRKVFS